MQKETHWTAEARAHRHVRGLAKHQTREQRENKAQPESLATQLLLEKAVVGG